MYNKLWKRVFDFISACIVFLLLLPLMLVLTALGAICMHGNPFFLQYRPGRNEKIIRMIKFRTMTCQKDQDGKLLPDEQRITPYGRFLRGTSLDELPELLNIIKGDMSFVGPRPQLVRDMVFMTADQRKRHTVRPGLTGLAQVSGRNALVWERKIELDLVYISDISFSNDFRILLKTAKLMLFGGESTDETNLTDDFGDYLLKHERITLEDYNEKMKEALELLEE